MREHRPQHPEHDHLVATQRADDGHVDAWSGSTIDWFREHVGTPSKLQQQAWQAIRAGHSLLLAANTGSGKTLAALLPLLDAMLQDDTQPRLRVIYISPLRALAQDMHRHLQAYVADISTFSGHKRSLNIALRTGDTLAAERRRFKQNAADILITTPESLFILLVSHSARKLLSSVRHVIIDEVHAVAANKRGSHLCLSLERLQKLVSRPLQRIGLSATQKPLPLLAQWLCGGRPCEVLDATRTRDLQLQLQLPAQPLAALLSQQQFADICAQIAALLQQHQVLLVFVNTRRMAERTSRALSELLKQNQVGAYHGSLSRDARLQTEQDLRDGKLRVVVATSALELGIDIGSIDCVVQLGSPKSIAALLQRIGRSGHHFGGIPKARLFPLTRNDLLECTALLHAIEQTQLDCLQLPALQMDVLAQHIIAECCCQSSSERSLASWVRNAWPYRDISDDTLLELLQMLASGYTRRNDLVRINWNRSNQSIGASKQLRALLAMNAGAIPEQFDQDVWLLPEREHLGTVDEEFAFESMVGDVVQLGNRSLQVIRSSAEGLFMQAADEHPPALPFWFGEGAGRSQELGQGIAVILAQADVQTAAQIAAAPVTTAAQAQLAAYLAANKAVLGKLPHARQVVIERFFDSTGNFHLLIHNVYGIRVNRAWGLALRKRFCRQFNFELQANATDNGILLSLGPTHSFPLSDIVGYLHHSSVRELLLQALLDTPMFINRWRWVCNTALAVLRHEHGRKVAPQVQRNQSEDLLALLFPDQLACLENIRGEREIPAHPLVQQAIHDCLFDAMDIATLEQILLDIETQRIHVHSLDTNAPSPLAEELVHCQPWAFLDDGEAEERRTRTVSTRRQTPDLTSALSMGRLAASELTRLRRQRWPQVDGPKQLYELLCQSGVVPIAEASHGAPAGISNALASRWPAWFAALRRELRASIMDDAQQQPRFWIADEWQPMLALIYPAFSVRESVRNMTAQAAHQAITQADRRRADQTPDHATEQASDQATAAAVQQLLRAYLRLRPLLSAAELGQQLLLPSADIVAALLGLEVSGELIRMPADDSQSQPELWAWRHDLQTLRHSVAARC